MDKSYHTNFKITKQISLAAAVRRRSYATYARVANTPGYVATYKALELKKVLSQEVFHFLSVIAKSVIQIRRHHFQ